MSSYISAHETPREPFAITPPPRGTPASSAFETLKSRFLQEACVDDPSLRREVASLLNHASASDGTIATSADDGPILQEDSLLGHYRVGKRLGVGGMGEVFRGVDTRLNRSVAIKVSRRAFSARLRAPSDDPECGCRSRPFRRR